MSSNISRVLRKNQTEQEAKLWYWLRKRGINNLKFRRQFKIGRYISDFCCLSKKLVIEVDGGHHAEPEFLEQDKEKEKFIKSRGFKVIRFWNSDVDDNLDGVIDKILDETK